MSPAAAELLSRAKSRLIWLRVRGLSFSEIARTTDRASPYFDAEELKSMYRDICTGADSWTERPNLSLEGTKWWPREDRLLMRLLEVQAPLLRCKMLLSRSASSLRARREFLGS